MLPVIRKKVNAMKECPKCKQPNTTYCWWEDEKNKRWVCYPCGMNRRDEQNHIEKKWKQDNIYATAPST